MSLESFDGGRAAPGLVESMLRYRGTVAAVALLLALLGALSGFLLTTPQASARFAVADQRGTTLFGGGTGGDSQARLTAQRAQFAESDRVLAAVSEVSDIDLAPTQLRRRVSTRTAADSDVVVVTATGPTAGEAAALADAVVEAYQRETEALTQDLLDQQTRALTELRDSAARRAQAAQPDSPVAAAGATTLADLDQRLATIQLEASQFGDGTTFINTADAALAGGGLTDVVRNGVAGLLVGVVLGAVAAYVRADRSTSVRDSDAPGEILGAPLLGEVPELRGGPQRRALADLQRMPSEEFQFVAAGLRTVLRTGVVLVTSTDREDGRTVTAANVAAAAARDGLRVVVVDADARSRGLSLLHGASDDSPGLTDLAAGRVPLEAVLYPVELSRQHVMTVIPAGTETADLPNLFRSQGMSGAVRQLRVAFDLVVVDSPPALSVPDTASLAPLADGVLVVVRPDTGGRRLRDLRRRLELFPSRLLGYAFNRSEAAVEAARLPRRAA